MDKIYAMIGAVVFALMVNFLVDYMPVVAVSEVEAVETVEPVESLMETDSVNANVRIIHNETVQVKEVYYDENEKVWYVVGDGWALQGTEETAKNAMGESVRIEFYIVDGVEYISSWGVVDERENYKL